MKSTSKKLIVGIGNASRGDDGLGWKFLDLLKERGFDDWELIYRYQLNVEDADLVKEADSYHPCLKSMCRYRFVQ
jgi:Ni,Fe-hydrogenase maturation factor